MNDLYAKTLSKNIKAARRARIENKINCNCKAPYGYIFSSEHILVPDAQVAPVIRFIFEEYVRNPNAARIANVLNQQGIPTRSTHLLQ